MVNAQEWLDNKYPKKSGETVKNSRVPKLEGNLELKDFANLKKVDFSNNNKLTSLIISNCPNLTEIDCSNNQLVELKLNGLPELTRINCKNNQLAELDLTNLSNPEKLISLDATNNRLSEECLISLKSFANFKELRLDNDKIFSESENDNQSVISSTTTGSVPLSPTPTISSSVFFNKFNKGVRKEKMQELAEQNEELIAKLGKVTQELVEEKGKNNNLQKKLDEKVKEKDLLQEKFAQSREELISVQKVLNQELNYAKDRLIDVLTKDVINSTSYRNVLLIGRTGSGKSALANILSGTNKFIESDGAVSETKEINSEKFEYGGIKYRIIDTIGIDDNTGLTNEEIIQRIAETAYKMKNGVTQILFVTKDRFAKNEIDIYNLLRGTIFDERVTRYTTIVRTNSTSFEDNEWCEEQKQKIIESGGELTEVISSCNKFIYVDNGGQKNRKKSRTILLNHLATCWGTYRPQNLKELNKRIGEKMKEKEEYQQKEVSLHKEIKEIEKKMEKGEIEESKGKNILDSKNKELVEIGNLEKMIKIEINNNISQHMEEKGLGELWLEIIGKTFEKAIEAVPKCRIM